LNNRRLKGRGTHFVRKHAREQSASAMLANKMGATPLQSAIIQSRANRLVRASVTLRLSGTVNVKPNL